MPEQQSPQDINSNISVARASYKAYVDKDRHAMERYVSDDLHFTSPYDNRIGRETYFERCWPFNEQVEDFKFINLVPDGDRVFVTYEAYIKGGHAFRNTEILTIKNGQISDVEVYFGWTVPHAAMPGEFKDPSTPNEHDRLQRLWAGK